MCQIWGGSQSIKGSSAEKCQHNLFCSFVTCAARRSFAGGGDAGDTSASFSCRQTCRAASGSTSGVSDPRRPGECGWGGGAVPASRALRDRCEDAFSAVSAFLVFVLVNAVVCPKLSLYECLLARRQTKPLEGISAPWQGLRLEKLGAMV